MENNKYYTPDISEFHIDFEYEVHTMSIGGLYILDFEKNITEIINEPNIKVWTKVTFINNIWFRTLVEIGDLIDNKQIRVKYLDEKDLIDLGFTFDGTFYCIKVRESFEYWIDVEETISEKGLLLRITGDDNEFDFRGYIKNKSELIKILKQLDII